MYQNLIEFRYTKVIDTSSSLYLKLSNSRPVENYLIDKKDLQYTENNHQFDVSLNGLRGEHVTSEDKVTVP